jgi:hypothetical protein
MTKSSMCVLRYGVRLHVFIRYIVYGFSCITELISFIPHLCNCAFSYSTYVASDQCAKWARVCRYTIPKLLYS